MSEYPPIEAHGLVGDLQTCALVSREGAIDWYPFPASNRRPSLPASSTPNEVVTSRKGLRAGGELGVFGIDVTAHDDRTVRELSAVVERLLWVSGDADGRSQFDLRNAGRRPTY